MPVTYWIDAELDLLWSKGTGELCASDLAGYFEASRADPAVRPDMDRIMDLSEAEAMPPLGDIPGMAALARHNMPEPGGRIVVIASSPAVYNICRLLKNFTNHGDSLFIARNRAEALRHLGRSAG